MADAYGRKSTALGCSTLRGTLQSANVDGTQGRGGVPMVPQVVLFELFVLLCRSRQGMAKNDNILLVLMKAHAIATEH